MENKSKDLSVKDKKYGLILPDKPKSRQPVFQASRNVFGDDSESEEESKRKPVLLRPSQNTNRHAKIAQKKAMHEDPTVYQYDEIYDSMTRKKEEKKVKNKEEKKPKYIENLMKTANKRKIENERRIERQIQKERENEGDQFADKEVFVTSAYKKKLEEMQLEEEKEKREEYLERIGDVTKQKDLGGFYRHLYEQKLGSEIETDKPVVVENSNQEAKNEKSDLSKKRNYRKRKSSDDKPKQLSDGEIEDSEEEINRFNLEDIKTAKKLKQTNNEKENIDADSDFSVDDPSEDEEVREYDSTVLTNKQQQKSKLLHEKPDKTPETVTESKSKRITKEEESIETKIVKPKIDIWKKRTVGEVFQQALKRYYERKAARGT